MNKLQTSELPAERREKIGGILQQKRIIRIDDLCRQLQASPATVRRDLHDMEKLGQLLRVHGGAVAAGGGLHEPLFDDKTTLAANQKERIANAALKWVKPNDSIFLDGGSTVLALAKLLQRTADITVVTNSLRVAGTLSGAAPAMILIGGEFRKLSQTFVGPLTEPLITRLHIDTAFMGTVGLSPEEGMTTTDPREAYTKELLLAHARQVVLLADSSKIGKMSFVRFAALSEVDVLITDRGIDPKAAAKFRKKGIKIVIV